MTSLHADMHTRTPLTRGSMSDLRNSIELRDTEYSDENDEIRFESPFLNTSLAWQSVCLLYTSDAADDLLCVDLGGRRIIKKKK